MKSYRRTAARVLPAVCICLALAFTAQAGVEEFSVNGLKVILKQNAANEIIAARLYLRGGVMNLSDADQGIESLLFECAAKGSRRYPREALNTIMDKTAADIGSDASRDYSVVTLRCLRADLGRVWDVYADVVMHPALDPQDVEVVRQNQLLRLKQRKDSPDNALDEIANDVCYADHPYRRDPLGTESVLAGISIDQMKKYLAEHLQTSRLLLVVVGNVGREELQKLVAASFGTLPKGSYETQRPAPLHLPAPGLKVVERDLPTNYITGRFAAPGSANPDYVPMSVAVSILSSRLFEEVRTKRNLSYAPGAGLYSRSANSGYLYVSTVAPDTTIKVMLGEVRKLQQTPVSAGDLHDRIALFLTRYNLRHETNDAQAEYYALYELLGNGWQEGDRFLANMQKVTVADVQRVANKYMRNIQFVVLGNPKLIDAKTFLPPGS